MPHAARWLHASSCTAAVVLAAEAASSISLLCRTAAPLAPPRPPALVQLEAQQREVESLGGAAADLAAQVEISRAGVASAASSLSSSRGRAVAAHSDVERLAEENARLAAQLQRSQAEADQLAAKAEEARAAEARLEEVKVWFGPPWVSAVLVRHLPAYK